MLFLILSALSVTLIYVWLFLYKNRIQRMVTNIPGPKPLPILGTMHLGFKKTEFIDTMKRMYKEYGSTFSLWFGPFYCAVITDPKDVEIIYKHNTELHKSFIYKKLLPWLGQGLVTVPSIDKWRKHRKILTPTFHFKILEDFMPVFNSNGVILTLVLQKKLGRDVNVMEHMSRLSLDIICETAMGTQMNAQLTENSKFVKASAKVSDLNTERAFNIMYYIDWIFHMSPIGKEVDRQTDYINGVVDKKFNRVRYEQAIPSFMFLFYFCGRYHAYAVNNDNGWVVIQERQKVLDAKTADQIVDNDNTIGQRKLHTFLDLLLEYRKSGGAEFTDEDIRDEVNTFMFAGHDTTSLTMSYFCYSIAQNPEIQEKLYEEQKAIFGDSEPNLDVTNSHLVEMKYLEKTIKETLRLFPPSMFTMRTLKNDLQLSNGYIIPAGGSIMILALCAHLNPEVFPDPLKFNPDRFDSHQIRNSPFSFIPFSAGPRNCIGQRYAMMEMKVVLSHLIRNFKILPSTIPIKLYISVLLKSENGVHVKLESRK